MRQFRQVVFLLLGIFLPIAEVAQSNQSAPNSSIGQSDILLNWDTVERNIYANARPYVNLSLADLRSELPELRGLDPAPDQSQLPSLLDKTGERTGDLLHNMPNLIAHEDLVTQMGPKGKARKKEYEYLILSRLGPNDTVMLDEYRTGERGGNKQSGNDPFTKGFTSEWLLFYPDNQSQARYRYLGRQQVEGHQTFVVAFAQIPDQVRLPARVDFNGALVPVLNQGVAWIDESDFRIVRMRTDLLAPRPDIHLQKMTAEVHFREVRLPEVTSGLWVPFEAMITWNFEGQTVQQRHTYSKYRFYAVKTKILP